MITLESLHLTRTYAGCYEGPPPLEHVFESAKAQAIALFGAHVPLVILDAPISTHKGLRGRELQMLPEWRILAELKSFTTVKDHDATGSHLIVVAFSDASNFDIEPILASINWSQQAADYHW